MASTVPTNPSTSATNVAPMAPTQAVYLMPAQQRGGTPRNVRPVPGVECLSAAIIVIAIVLAFLGGVAVGIKARHAYLGNAIWTGVLFLLPTGIIGLFVHRRRTSLCMNTAFLLMTLVSSAAAFQVFVYALISACDEYYYCSPEVDWGHDCPPQWSRVLVNVTIVLCAFAALVLVIISSSLTLYGTFTCCFTCCHKCCCCMNNNPPPPVQVQYSPYTEGAMAAPMSSQNMQVMAAPQLMPHGSTSTQQARQQENHQQLLVVAPQSFPQNAPPAYMAATNVSLSTPPQAGAVSEYQPFTAGNPQPTAGHVPVTEGKPVVADPGTIVQPSAPGQIAINSQNWQTF